MPHYKKFFDGEFVGSWDLPDGRDVVLVIANVQADKVKGPRGETKKPSVTFTKGKKKLLLNSTNAKTIAGLYGVYTEKWIGKPISIYATTTEAFGEQVDCVRVRPTIPRGRPNQPTGAHPPPAEEREPGSDDDESEEQEGDDGDA